MKIAIGGLHQESNSFSPVISCEDLFHITYGAAIMDEYRETNSNLGGIIAALDEAGAAIIPSVAMNAISGGPVDAALVEKFLCQLFEVIDANLPVDGVFLDLHGATELEGGDDGCGFILERIRSHVGQQVVIVNTTDLHANITDRMAANSDAISGFQTYPHQDYCGTGYRAATQGLMLLQNKPLYQARVRIPMIVPAEGYNTNEGVFAELVNSAKQLVADGKIIDFSIYQMQPWLDAADAGSTVLVSAADRETAAAYAQDLARRLFDLRKDMTIHLYSVDEVIDAAKANETAAPVILVDSADSPNAGSSADSSFVLSRLLERGETIKTCLVVSDAPAAAHAFEVGVGNEGDFSLGGTREPRFQKATKVHAYVTSLHDGIYYNTFSQGLLQNTGKSAVLQEGNIDIVVYTKMQNSSDPQCFRAFGIEPSMYRLALVKSATQYKESYSKFSTLFYPTDTPGSSTANLASLPFQRLPRPFYPLDEIDDFDDRVTFVRGR